MSDSYKVIRHSKDSRMYTEYDIHETADKIREEYTRRIKKPDFTEHTGEPEWN